MYDALSEAEWEKVDRVWDLLEETDIDQARSETNVLLGSRPRHPDLLVLDAAVAIEEGDADRALDALRGAERSADPALFFHLRALARFHRVDLEAARADADKALAVRPQLAEAHALLSRVHEMLGQARTRRAMPSRRTTSILRPFRCLSMSTMRPSTRWSSRASPSSPSRCASTSSTFP
jgi:uncharacterized protein HemY